MFRTPCNVQVSDDDEITMRNLKDLSPAELDEARGPATDFLKQVGNLLHNSKYMDECERLNVNPYFAADYIVFLGKETRDRVLKEGVKNVLGQDPLLGIDPVSSQLPPHLVDLVFRRVRAFLRSAQD
jgi:hypothetical protein